MLASIGNRRLLFGWLLVTALAGIAGCALPMLKTLGYEYSLLISLVSSAGSGHLAACYPTGHSSRDERFHVLRLYLGALSAGMLLLAAPLVIALINRFRVPPCNESEGLLFYLLMPVCSVAAAAAFGLTARLLCSRAGISSALWFAIFVGSLVQALYTFYSTPAVFLFGPFFGYFPGVLYDELVSVEPRFVAYRLATLFQTATVISMLCWLTDPTSQRLSAKRFGVGSKARAASCVFFLCSVGMYLAGPGLGHRTERAQLEKLLSRKLDKERLELFFPAGTDEKKIQALADDAEFCLSQVERYIGAGSDGRITVFFFSGAAQKAAAMGAAGTNVTKPWRSEIYVTIGDPPHEVLRHELAHAVAARFGSGPFAVPGDFAGLWPDPGRLEGLAVAAQGPRGELTVHQWAAAMKRLGLLPSVNTVFGFGFFKLAASAAYTAAGSFCSWIRDTYGPEVLLKAYRTGDWEQSAGSALEVLEARWLASLDATPLCDDDLAAAKHRFDRPSVIHSVCVHEVARLGEEAQRLADAGLWDSAWEIRKEAHERSGGSASTGLALFYVLADSGKVGEARKKAGELMESSQMDSVSRAALEEILADFDLAENQNAKAMAKFEDLASRAADESDKRRLEVKARLALEQSPKVRLTLQALQRRPGQRSVSQNTAILAIAESACEAPDNPILLYLLARQHFNSGDWSAAIDRLEKALAKGLDGAASSLGFEARMLKAQAVFQSGRFEEARALFNAIASDERVRLGARAWALDWEDRCVFHRKRDRRAL